MDKALPGMVPDASSASQASVFAALTQLARPDLGAAEREATAELIASVLDRAREALLAHTALEGHAMLPRTRDLVGWYRRNGELTRRESELRGAVLALLVRPESAPFPPAAARCAASGRRGPCRRQRSS